MRCSTEAVVFIAVAFVRVSMGPMVGFVSCAAAADTYDWIAFVDGVVALVPSCACSANARSTTCSALRRNLSISGGVKLRR